MFRSLFWMLLFLPFADVAAQQNKSLHKENLHFNFGRTQTTTPPFGTEEVNKVIGRSNFKDKYNTAIAQADFESLSEKGKFTYCISYPETYRQICSLLFYDSVDYRIFVNMPFIAEGIVMSGRQRNYLKNARVSTIKMLKACINDSLFVGLNYKEVILDLKAMDLIPALVKNYTLTRDKDLLTLFLQMMIKEKFKPFLDSRMHKLIEVEKNKPYSEQYIPFNAKNVAEIIGLATTMSLQQKK